jgi:outer membrane protein TolC
MATLRAKFLVWLLVGLMLSPPTVVAQPPCYETVPEQRRIQVRHPTDLARYPLPEMPPPPTVTDPQFDAPPLELTLDEAIRIALANSEVVRVLAGVTAVASGRTIYDAAITNNGIDQERARFDPNVVVNNSWNRFEPPSAFLIEPVPPMMFPPFTVIGGTRTDNYDLDLELSKVNVHGGTMAFRVDDTTSRFRPGRFALNPSNSTSLTLTATQPLLQGGGAAANLVPIILARIDTERSFFQFKDGVQELVRGVIQAYWDLVFARTDLWAREQQVEQLEFALEQAEGRARAGDISGAEVAQPRVSLASFRATLISARANVLSREAALRSILGWLPYGATRIVPVTPPDKEELELDWNGLVALAEQYRPDIVELKLILEADQQLLLQARNQALPRVDAVGLYRWNGLEGTMPNGNHISSSLSESTDWTMGINFSVPLGLRQSRATLRQRELLIARDRANLDQGLLSTTHTLALSVRNLDQFYEQYEAFQEMREAARQNLELQMGRYRANLLQYINVLQAIVDWGNAVSAEAQSLTQYNVEQANLQLETGTILESHGVRFFEERYGSVGPLGCFAPDVCYPRAMRPTDNSSVYPGGDEPAEEFFDLEDPLQRLRRGPLVDQEELPQMPRLPRPEDQPGQPPSLQPEELGPPP